MKKKTSLSLLLSVGAAMSGWAAEAPAASDTHAPTTLTNAAVALTNPPVEMRTNMGPVGVLPATIQADALADGSVTNAEIVPLIVIDDVPLLDAIKNLARQANVNYQFDPKLTAVTNQPNVTVRFENVTTQDALQAVLDNYSLMIVQDPKTRISRITTKDPKAEEPLYSKVVQLKYSNPTNVVSLLKSSLSPRSQVLADTRTSQLILTTTEKEMPIAEALLAKLDTATRQVLIEAQIWETTKNPRSIKGIDWSGTLENQNVTFGNGRTSGETITRSPGSSTTTTTPGGRTITTTKKSESQTTLATAVGNGGLSLDTARGLNPSTAFLNADGLSVVLSFLNRDNDTELVATPRAVTMDNQLATLSVTRAFPIFKITPGSANSPAGAEITYTNLGTILAVTPRIAANSNISLAVSPEVSDISAVDRQVLNGSINTANIYSIRRIETHVMVPSGNTLVMGGLINDRSNKSFTKVPFLGDLPGLGWAFRKEDKSRDKANLVLFITPTIIGESDFQLAADSSRFLNTKLENKPEPKESMWNSAKPHDWTKPKEPETKPLPAQNPDEPKAPAPIESAAP